MEKVLSWPFKCMEIFNKSIREHKLIIDINKIKTEMQNYEFKRPGTIFYYISMFKVGTN